MSDKPLYVFDGADDSPSLPPDFWSRIADDFAPTPGRPAPPLPAGFAYATTGGWAATHATADVTVERLRELMRSIPKPPPLPQPFRDATGRCYALLERFGLGGTAGFGVYDRTVVRVRDETVGRQLLAEADERGDRLDVYVGDLGDYDEPHRG